MKNNITNIDRVLSRLNKLQNLTSLATINSNWYDVLLLRAGIKKKVKFRLRSGGEYTLNSMQDLLDLWDKREIQLEFFKQKGIKVRISGNRVYFWFKGRELVILADKSQIGHTLTLIRELFVFEHEHYKFLDVKGKTVIDVGANIGDSPIYFRVEWGEASLCF